VPRNRREKEEVPGAAVWKEHSTGISTATHVPSGLVWNLAHVAHVHFNEILWRV